MKPDRCDHVMLHFKYSIILHTASIQGENHLQVILEKNTWRCFFSLFLTTKMSDFSLRRKIWCVTVVKSDWMRLLTKSKSDKMQVAPTGYVHHLGPHMKVVWIGFKPVGFVSMVRPRYAGRVGWGTGSLGFST